VVAPVVACGRRGLDAAAGFLRVPAMRSSDSLVREANRPLVYRRRIVRGEIGS